MLCVYSTERDSNPVITHTLIPLHGARDGTCSWETWAEWGVLPRYIGRVRPSTTGSLVSETRVVDDLQSHRSVTTQKTPECRGSPRRWRHPAAAHQWSPDLEGTTSSPRYLQWVSRWLTHFFISSVFHGVHRVSCHSSCSSHGFIPGTVSWNCWALEVYSREVVSVIR